MTSNDPSIKTPMFLSQNEENAELRRTTKWPHKFTDLDFTNKSNEETEYFIDRKCADLTVQKHNLDVEDMNY